MNKANIDKYIARLLMVSFFMPQWVQVLATAIPFVYFFVCTLASKPSVPKRNFFWLLLLGSGYLLFLLSIPLTPIQYRVTLLHLCETREASLIAPLVFAVCSPALRQVILGELMYFVYGCAAACAAANGDFIYHYLAGPHGQALSHVRYRVMFENFTTIHPTYMGMFLCFSICITLLYYKVQDRVDRILKYALVYLLLVFLLSVLAKAPLVALVIILLHYAYLRRQRLYRHKALIVGLAACVVAACLFIPFIGQRVSEMLDFAGGRHGSAADNSVYVRQLIWHTDINMLHQHWLTGIGPGRIRHLLDERYFFYSIANRFWVGYYDPHNEYLFEWLSFGILGIVLFVVVLVTHFVRAIRAKNHLYLYLLILVSVTFFTETILSRQWGVLFYAVFTSLFFFSAAPAKQNEA